MLCNNSNNKVRLQLQSRPVQFKEWRVQRRICLTESKALLLPESKWWTIFPLTSPLANINIFRKSLRLTQSSADTSSEAADDSTSLSPNSSSASVPGNSHGSCSFEDKDDDKDSVSPSQAEYEIVLVVGINSSSGRSEVPGMLSEEKVMESAAVCIK